MNTKSIQGYGFAWLSRKDWERATICFAATVEESIRQSITSILRTPEGERVLDPTFGSGLRKFAYARVDANLMQDIANEVQRSIAQCEPRITVSDVQVRRQDLEGHDLQIHISYRIRKGSILQSYIFPLNLLAS